MLRPSPLGLAHLVQQTKATHEYYLPDTSRRDASVDTSHIPH